MSAVFAGKIQDVILQENLEKEDEVLVSLAGLKQVNGGLPSVSAGTRHSWALSFPEPADVQIRTDPMRRGSACGQKRGGEISTLYWRK